MSSLFYGTAVLAWQVLNCNGLLRDGLKILCNGVVGVGTYGAQLARATGKIIIDFGEPDR